jgi:hypothetical protein
VYHKSARCETFAVVLTLVKGAPKERDSIQIKGLVELGTVGVTASVVVEFEQIHKSSVT